jgi:hypothetical protein
VKNHSADCAEAITTNPPVLHVARLIAGGFQRSGTWQLDPESGSIRFFGESELPKAAGVYAYAIGDQVYYVGSAQRGLRHRLRHYEITKRLRTALRVRQEIISLLNGGRTVDVFTLVPGRLSWNGLPVDGVAGIEEGLIRELRPVWNRRGMGGKL